MSKKFKLLITILLVVLIPTLIFASSKEKVSKGGKKYEGVTITFLIQGGAAYDIPNATGKTYLQKMSEEFKEQTGCTVKIVGAPWENLMPKIMNDVTTGANQFDGGLYDIEFQYTIYPYLLNINPYIKKTGYNMKGFVKPVYKYGEWHGKGIRYGLPLLVGVSPILYRTDIINRIPSTWDGYYKMLDKIKESGKVKYPETLAGVPAQLVKTFLARFWSTGDTTISKDWKPNINDKNGVWALEQLDRIIKNYCAPGVVGYDNPDAANEFVKGDAAIYEDWLAFIVPSLNNPKVNKVVGKNWAVAKYPEGGTGNFVQHNFVIMKASKHPDATFDFIAYCTSKKNMKRALLDWGIDVARASVLNDPDVLAKFPYEKGYSAALNAGRPIFPGIPYWLQLFMELGKGLSSYVSGEIKDPKKALDIVAKKWSKLIAENPLHFEYHE